MLIDLNKNYTDVFVRKFAFRKWFAIVDFPQSVVIAGKYHGYMDCALYILSSYGVKRPHIVLRYKPNFMFKG